VPAMMCDRIVRNKFAEKVKNSFYGRRDAAVKLSDETMSSFSSGRQHSGENIARLLAAATSAELALNKQSPDSKKQSRHFNSKSLVYRLSV